MIKSAGVLRKSFRVLSVPRDLDTDRGGLLMWAMSG